MAVAPVIDETPEGHAEELDMMQSVSPAGRARVIAIASCYVDGVSPHLYNTPAIGNLLFELKSARLRFGLEDDFTVSRAVRGLRDPTGW